MLKMGKKESQNITVRVQCLYRFFCSELNQQQKHWKTLVKCFVFFLIFNDDQIDPMTHQMRHMIINIDQFFLRDKKKIFLDDEH